MASEEAPPHGRYWGRPPRAFQDIPTSEQRSFFGSNSSKKTQQKTMNDKLVWFSPVHSPLLSPAREKTLQSVKKKVRQSSIFSIQSRGKGSIEAEEPTSPKVSCIGQVRAHRKDKDPFADAVKKKSSQSKPGSMSPARFFASPGRASKWGSLFGSRKDSSQSSSGYGEGEVSCFALPFESRSGVQTDKTCAFLARTLDPYLEARSSDDLYKNKLMQSSKSVSNYQFKKQGNDAAADGYIGTHARDEVDSHMSTSTGFGRISQRNGAYEMSGTAMTTGIDNSVVCQRSSLENSSNDDRDHGKHIASRQKLTYEELPSLHCGAFTKQNMKISVEVVPETWLWRNGERLRPDSTSHLSCIPDQSVSTSREDSQKAQRDEPNMPLSPCGDTQSCARDAEECADQQILIGSHLLSSGSGSRTFVKANAIPVDDSTCQLLDSEDERKNATQHTSLIEPSQSHVASPCCTHIAAVKEKNGELRSSAGCQGGANGVQSSPGFGSGTNGTPSGKQQVHFEKLKSEADVVKSRGTLGTSEVKPGHQTVRRVGGDVGKENYSIAFPQLFERSRPSVNSKEDGKQFWSMFKGRKNEAFSGQPFSALILVGYDQSTASKGMGCKDEELLKGILEVGRLSLQCSGKYFQVLNSDAAFNRSRSVTSHRTVIRLQRCNSDPCRSSC
ncbi:hypothetical protein GOP47_0029679 [Adiantum capillus-veneris]|nr:hypothetical protein GOP47_0029679 [Adiantum capillus-veneris]